MSNTNNTSSEEKRMNTILFAEKRLLEEIEEQIGHIPEAMECLNPIIDEIRNKELTNNKMIEERIKELEIASDRAEWHEKGQRVVKLERAIEILLEALSNHNMTDEKKVSSNKA